MGDSAADQRPNLLAIILVVFTNMMMLLNQLNIASVYLLISSEFHQSVTGLGALTSSYFLAYGSFIVPGGIIAARIGPRKTIVMGALVSSVVFLASSLSPNFDALVLFRFFEGLGYALVFPASLILNVRFFRGRSVGLSMGLSAVAYSIGGTVAFFAWPVLGEFVGWRASVAASGAIALIPSIALLALLPGEEALPEFNLTRKTFTSVVFSRPIIILAVMLLGVGATIALANSFMVYYMENYFDASPGLAGFVAGLNTIVQMFAGVGIGRLYDRAANARIMLLAMAVLLSFGVSFAALGSIPAAAVASVVSGVGAAGGYVVTYSATRNALSSLPGYQSVALAWVNSFGFLGQVFSPLYFSFLVLQHGYPTAWLVGGLVSICLAIPVLWLRTGAGSVTGAGTVPRPRQG